MNDMSTASKSPAKNRLWSEPAFGAYWVLRIGFVALPLLMGIDKFANVMTYWPNYLAPWIIGLLPFSAQAAMYVVGVIEIAAAIAVAVKPRFAAYVVAIWLFGIIINLVTYPADFDVALRDLGLFIAAIALARLSAVYDRPRREAHAGEAK